MNAKQIIIKYLKKNGYDGLCNLDEECGCSMDDICYWECCRIRECEPAYRRLVDSEEFYTNDKNYGTKIDEPN